MQDRNLEYVGFWPRVGATLIDTVITVLLTYPLLIAVYGWSGLTDFDEEAYSGYLGPADLLISVALPAVAVILCWRYWRATPGKMVVSAQVVDAKTGRALSVGQSIVRYLMYIVAMLPLGLGVVWVAFDPRKQGWHDKVAGSVVIRSRQRGQEPVRFDDA